MDNKLYNRKGSLGIMNIIGRDILETLTSSLYENPIVAFREYVQNSVDAYYLAKKTNQIKDPLRIDITVNKEKREIYIKDNGYGITENFEEIMRQIGNSGKLYDEHSIGFRGIGRLSGMPFCDKLIFRNKIQSQDYTQTFTWDGTAYKRLLSKESASQQTLEKVIADITEYKKVDDADITTNDHFFEVQLIGYDSELGDVILHQSFRNNLSKLLPVRYDDKFVHRSEIEHKYQDFFGKKLQDYTCCIYLDGKELTKPYRDDQHILESGIQFWEISIKTENPSESSSPDTKPTGLMWFTFNRKMTAKKNDPDYGILVRSKNVLMGGNDTIADAVNLSQEITTSYRELVQTLQGVYGELLIDSNVLMDNASRNWFKPDSNSKQLKRALADFMKKLYKYRYAASRFMNSHGAEDSADYQNKYNAMKEAFISLLTEPDDREVSQWFESIKNSKKDSEENVLYDKNGKILCEEEDIPRQPKTIKKFYHELMEVAEEFFNRIDRYDIYLQLRACIKQRYNKEE